MQTYIDLILMIIIIISIRDMHTDYIVHIYGILSALFYRFSLEGKR